MCGVSTGTLIVGHNNSCATKVNSIQCPLPMVLLHRKLLRSIKSPFALEHTHRDSEADSASLHGFRFKILDFASKLMLKPCTASLLGLNNCFHLINFTNRAFSEMVAEIDYPMNRWGTAAVEEYFNYTLTSLDLLNLITGAVLHLRHARISIPHSLEKITSSHSFSNSTLKKIIIRRNPESEEILNGADSNKERVLLQALKMSREISISSLGLVLSGLCSDREIYLEIRKAIDGETESHALMQELQNLRKLSEEMIHNEIMEEVNEVNAAIEDISGEKLETKLEILEKSIEGIDKEADNLFSETMATRNELLDNYRNLLK